MAQPTAVAALEARRDEILQQIATIGEMSSGSLSRRRIRCGNPKCRCKREGAPGHGPYWYLTRKVKGRTVTRAVPAREVEAVQRRIAERKRLRALTADLVEVSDRLSRARPAGGTAPRRRALRQEFDAELEALLGAGPADEQDLEAVGIGLRRKALALAARALQRRFNADRSDRSARRLPCTCGQEARYAGRHPKSFVSAVGTLRLERACCHCAECGKGFYPRDRALGLAGGSLSPAVLRMSGSAAALVSFAEANGLLAELAGVRVGTKRVERSAEALGREIAAVERDPSFAARVPAAATMYLGMDGTGVPVRKAEVAGRRGKQADGTARTREVKLVVIWTAEKIGKEGRPERDEGSVTYSGAVLSAASRDTDAEPSEFARLVRREAERRGFYLAPRRVVIGDGAAWIWELTAELFPGAIQIVDLFHARERLWDVARELFRGDAGRIETWAEERCEELEQGRTDVVLAALRSLAGVCEEARKCAGYVESNRERMRYADFRAQGLCVGSGVVEAGCKTAVRARLKRAGMRWTVEGANAIISLRCCKLSGRYEDFWEERAVPAV